MALIDSGRLKTSQLRISCWCTTSPVAIQWRPSRLVCTWAEDCFLEGLWYGIWILFQLLQLRLEFCIIEFEKEKQISVWNIFFHDEAFFFQANSLRFLKVTLRVLALALVPPLAAYSSSTISAQAILTFEFEIYGKNNNTRRNCSLLMT